MGERANKEGMKYHQLFNDALGALKSLTFKGENRLGLVERSQFITTRKEKTIVVARELLSNGVNIGHYSEQQGRSAYTTRTGVGSFSNDDIPKICLQLGKMVPTRSRNWNQTMCV